MLQKVDSTETLKTLSSFSFHEADDIESVLESLNNGLHEVTRMERNINAPSTPSWIAEKMKDELEELINNIKASAISVITTLSSISQSNQELDVNSLEYRLRKTRIACLSLKFVDLMKRCEQFEIDLQTPMIERVRVGFHRQSQEAIQVCTGCNEMRKESIARSVNDLRQMFAQVAVNLHETNKLDHVTYDCGNESVSLPELYLESRNKSPCKCSWCWSFWISFVTTGLFGLVFSFYYFSDNQ